MEPTYGDYDVNAVDGITDMRERLADAKMADSYEEYVKKVSHILKDYLSFGNNKIADSVAIFNMNSATDCPNADTELCQVPWDMCYAHKAENIYKTPLDYRRRQEYLWDNVDAETWALAFLEVIGRKRNPVDTIRFSEAGDFRSQSDISKVNRIAGMLGVFGIDVYTYSASSNLNWSDSEHFTVNRSNDFRDYGDKRYFAIDADAELPDGAVWCPYDKFDGEIKCGDCRLCIEPDAPDVAIPLH